MRNTNTLFNHMLESMFKPEDNDIDPNGMADILFNPSTLALSAKAIEDVTSELTSDKENPRAFDCVVGDYATDQPLLIAVSLVSNYSLSFRPVPYVFYDDKVVFSSSKPAARSALMLKTYVGDQDKLVETYSKIQEQEIVEITHVISLFDNSENPSENVAKLKEEFQVGYTPVFTRDMFLAKEEKENK